MTSNRRNREKALARQGKLLALIVAATMLLWMAAQWLGGALGLDPRYVFLFDMLALAAFAWVIIVGLQLWRKRRP